MITTCLINNFNYARYLGDALDSVLAQSVPFDEIIVVDDGSTDGSAALVTRWYGRHPKIQVVSKANEGQLSCFNEGFARSKGDILYFLDADDLYEPDYLARSLEVYRRKPQFDFVTCAYRQFGQHEALVRKFASDRDLGYSVIRTARLRDWIGGPTSCLSMRRRVLEKILPLPFTEAWRIRADDCLVFGASLAGARKYYLAEPLVRYRVHGQNQFFGRTNNPLAVYSRRLATNTLFAYLERQLCYDLEHLAEHHHREFCTIPLPTRQEFVKYLRISMSAPVSWSRRLACMGTIAGHYLRASMRPSTATCEPSAADTDDVKLPRLFAPADSAERGPQPTSSEQRRAA